MKLYAFKDISNTDSSSGGAFPAIIDVVLKINNCMPIVYGAAFDEHFNVTHIRACNRDEYKKLQGSKYVRSNLGDCFDRVIEDLNNNLIVIFSGTPCQIAGLKKKLEFSNVNTDKLLCIDIVCHGTPKQIVWTDFKNWLEKKESSKLVNFSFRYQKAKWKSYPTMAEFDNGKRMVNSFKLRRYTELFYSDLTLYEGCYKCPFTSVSRNSDITIGDFWGIRKVLPDFRFKEEVSQIMVTTQKGEDVTECLLRNDTYFMREADFENSIKYQQCFNNPTKKPSCVDEFWSDYQRDDFETVLKKYGKYNLQGYIKHCIKKMLGESGFLLLIKMFLKI